jgi:hypothetical protein
VEKTPVVPVDPVLKGTKTPVEPVEKTPVVPVDPVLTGTKTPVVPVDPVEKI